MNIVKISLFILFGFLSNSATSQNTKGKLCNREIVETFLNGFNDPAEFQTSLSLLSDDYAFQNPLVKLNSKNEFIELAQQIGEVLRGVHIIRITENKDWVSVLYEFKSSIPGVESNLATEWFKVENGLIKKSLLIYDASEWRKIYDQMKK